MGQGPVVHLNALFVGIKCRMKKERGSIPSYFSLYQHVATKTLEGWCSMRHSVNHCRQHLSSISPAASVVACALTFVCAPLC